MRRRADQQYYLARLMRSDKPEDRAVMEKVGVVFPNQQGLGHARQHRRRRGGARHAKNREAAVSFLEYLAGDAAQAYFANGNNEWPAVTERQGLAIRRSRRWAPFKSETIPVSVVGMNQVKVQQMLDRVGYGRRARAVAVPRQCRPETYPAPSLRPEARIDGRPAANCWRKRPSSNKQIERQRQREQRDGDRRKCATLMAEHGLTASRPGWRKAERGARPCAARRTAFDNRRHGKVPRPNRATPEHW